MGKSVDAFRTIGEVSEDLGVPKHVLRFWENKFPQLKPMKRGGGRRYYRPEDVALLIGIHRLLHGTGFTIKGVQKILREDGVETVKAAGREDLPAVRVAPGASSGKGSDGVGRVGKRVAKTQAAAAADPDMLQHLADVARELEACLKLVRSDGSAAKPKAARKTAVAKKRA